MDAFRIDKANFGYVDLYGDGSIELIAGFSDEAFRSYNWLFKDGNKQRSTGYSEYMLFSPQSSTKKPKDFNFWMARNIIPSDLNGDNIDDVVFIQHGQDFKPWKPQPNIVLLSEKNTYKKVVLPGPKSLFHGGATGDIDNDGDTDDSDEYLHKKRQAISKAVKSTKEGLDKKPTKRLSDIGGVTGIPALGDMIKGK